MEKETESNGTPVLSLWEGKTDMEKLSPISWEGIKEKKQCHLKISGWSWEKHLGRKG